ncbi:hypothetical protein [Desulfovibrio sp. MES5]|uniref:hypothetical protein n=1 Tax=Desulfovibrio sp. MES5 TaxID=1899016 RepID=UPI0025C4DD6F|nr:hypothetical protein [Desulfovibrio sp. MES5]
MNTDDVIYCYDDSCINHTNILPGWDAERLNDIYMFVTTSDVKLRKAGMGVIPDDIPQIYPSKNYFEIEERWNAATRCIDSRFFRRFRFSKNRIPFRNFDAMEKWQSWLQYETWTTELTCKLLWYGPWHPIDSSIYESKKSRCIDEFSLVKSIVKKNNSPYFIMNAIVNKYNGPGLTFSVPLDMVKMSNCFPEVIKSDRCNVTMNILNFQSNKFEIENVSINNSINLNADIIRKFDERRCGDAATIHEKWERGICGAHGQDQTRLCCYYVCYGKDLSQKMREKYLKEKYGIEYSYKTIERAAKKVIEDELYSKYGLDRLHE